MTSGICEKHARGARTFGSALFPILVLSRRAIVPFQEIAHSKDDPSTSKVGQRLTKGHRGLITDGYILTVTSYLHWGQRIRIRSLVRTSSRDGSGPSRASVPISDPLTRSRDGLA